MELSSIKHIESSKLADFKADLFITTLGFESRTTNVARLFESVSCRKIVLEPRNAVKEYAFHENLKYFTENGFEFIQVPAEFPDVDSILKDMAVKNMHLALDCTGMLPQWYYEFFKWFDDKQDGEEKVRIRVAYTMADYARQPSSRKVRDIIDFLKDDAKPANGKKVALLLGLGQEKNVSDSIYKLINPDLLYLFYADPPADKRFVEKVLINNHNLINEAPIRNLVAYPIRNGQAIYQSLINTILPLRDEYSIVLIPQGPKIFSVVSLLVHLGYPDIRISYPRLRKPPVIDRHASDEPVVLDILFEGEE